MLFPVAVVHRRVATAVIPGMHVKFTTTQRLQIANIREATMRLCPKELDKNLLSGVGTTAQKRLAAGLRLNVPEATALLALQVMHLARCGQHSVETLMGLGRSMLGRKQVIPGVESLLNEVQVEATFPDGSKLVTLHSPICNDNGDLSLALQGSFLPVPDPSVFASASAHPEEGLVPGEIITAVDKVNGNNIFLNCGRRYIELRVLNTADRPVQVGSHYHFIESNPYLKFDRRRSYGMRLNIAAGTSIRFEPGETKTVSLVSIAGHQIVRGGNNLCNGKISVEKAVIEAVMQRVVAGGFLHEEQSADDADEQLQKRRKVDHPAAYAGLPIPRVKYIHMYGPTTGDVLRLADTELFIRVERDCTVYGDECKFGGGKVLREGMGQATGLLPLQQLDTVITNALIIDYTGIYKADVGIKDGRIAGIGKAGNPDVMEGVSQGMVCGVNTEAIAGEGLILTAGGMDAHVHFICPQICEEALGSGLTTLLGGGTGPASGTCATTCTPGPWHLKMMLQATDGIPMNFGFTGKGNTSAREGLNEIIEAGAVGLKLHEDWATTPAAIDNCLSIAEEEDIQVCIHTDTLNESACVEHTLAAFKGRTIHTYHTEGAGGGHAPDIIVVAGESNVIPSSTNPTRPLTINTMAEHLDMLMVCHHLDKSIPEDIAFAESRIRQETVAAEDILQDMGAISIISSDSQAMGRVGEVIIRSWQTADKMKRQRGQLPEDKEADAAAATAHPLSSSTSSLGKPVQTDNHRVKRYIAKYTINPCIAQGMGEEIGSVEKGKLADLVLWHPSYFGVRPELVLKGGHIVWAQMGDANASIPTPQPVYGRPMYASKPEAAAGCSISFVSRKCIESGTGASYGLKKNLVAVKNTRNIGKKDMKLNDSTPRITVDPETYRVTADGEHLTCEPAKSIPLTQRYFMF